jgi:hypothetical protein
MVSAFVRFRDIETNREPREALKAVFMYAAANLMFNRTLYNLLPRLQKPATLI